jgi:hypothetical protein
MTTTKTVDFTNVLTIVVVGLAEADVDACRRAVHPLEVVRTSTAAQACEEIVRRRPLVVVMSRTLPAPDQTSLGETCLACGSEVITLRSFDDAQVLRTTMLEAIRIADKRRIPR